MIRVIEGLKAEKIEAISSQIPRIFDSTTLSENGSELIDAFISHYVIMTCYDSHVVLDLGGKLAFLRPDDYIRITLT